MVETARTATRRSDRARITRTSALGPSVDCCRGARACPRQEDRPHFRWQARVLYGPLAFIASASGKRSTAVSRSAVWRALTRDKDCVGCCGQALRKAGACRAVADGA